MLELFEFKLPFRAPFRTGSSVFKEREGILLRYKEGEFDLLSEASPLPGFSKELFSDVKEVLKKRKSDITDFFRGDFILNDIRNLNQINGLDIPSIQFALSFLGLSLYSERKDKTIYDLFERTPPQKIGVNDVISHGSMQEIEEQIENSVQQGFRVIKIKAPHPVQNLASLLSEIHKKYPEIQFRLDANQSWPVSSLQSHCNLFKNIPVQYIEEPCAIKHLSDIKVLQKKCSLPLALDESISDISDLKKVLKEYPNLFIIIKPMLLGNILKIHETISGLRSSFKHIVYTTTLEASIGRSMVAVTASLSGDQNLDHGLNTGHLFATDLLPDFKIESGLLQYRHRNPGTESFQNIKSSLIKQLG